MAIIETGNRLKERYLVTRVLDSGDDGTVYQARDEETGLQCVVREILGQDMEGVDPDLLTSQYYDVLATISSFDHPGLPRLLDHFRQDETEFVVTDLEPGVSLEGIVQMSVQALPVTQVVEWSLQICDIIGYLHGRPSPFVLSGLKARRFMVLPSGRLKLINLGLERCFSRKHQAVLAESNQDRYRDFVRFGHLLYYLVCRESMPPDGLLNPPPVSMNPRFYKVIQRCLKQESDPSFRTWADVGQALESVVSQTGMMLDLTGNDPVPSTTALPLPPLAWRQGLNATIQRVLSQPLLWLAGEVLLLLLVLAGVYAFFNPRLTYHKSSAMTYVVAGEHSLLAIDPISFRIVDRIEYEGGVAIGCVRSVQNGSRLLVLDSAQSRVYVLDTSNDHNLMQIAVEASPTELVISPDQKMAYCLHPRSHLISQIDLSTFGVVHIFVTAATPQSLAVSPDGDTLYVAMTRPDQIVAMTADTGSILGTVPAPHLIGPIALTQDGKELWMAATNTSRLNVYAVEEGGGLHNPVASLVDIGGKGPVGIQPSADGLEMDVVCRDSASIAVVKVLDHSAQPAVSLSGGQPEDYAFVPDPPSLWIAEPGPDCVVLFDLVGNQVLKRVSGINQPTSITVAP